MAISAVPYGLGMRGTGSWVDEQRPKSYRDYILHQWPNGMAPLTAMLSRLRSEAVNDPEFNWWTKALPLQAGAVSAVRRGWPGTDYAYSTPATSGDTLNIVVEADLAKEIRRGHNVVIGNSSYPDSEVYAVVNQVEVAGSLSRVSVTLLEDDTDFEHPSASPTEQGLEAANRLRVVGNSNPEGGVIPDSIGYDVKKLWNYTQIFRTPFEITRTMMKTKLRTGKALQEMEREALELHSIEMEKALFWGRRIERIGSNNQPERTTMGLIKSISTYASDHIYDFTTDDDYNGEEWAGTNNAGADWMFTKLANLYMYGRTQKLAFCGMPALLAIQNSVLAGADYNISAGEAKYGIKVTELIMPWGTLLLKTHPLFSYEPSCHNMMVVFEPENLKERYIDQTFKKTDKQLRDGGHTAIDGIKNEFLTEMGLEFHFPETGGILYGVGLDNPSP